MSIKHNVDTETQQKIDASPHSIDFLSNIIDLAPTMYI